jgi:hypothetical protein
MYATCELSHILTPSINSSLFVEALWSQPVLQVGKQVVVAWRKIRASSWNAPAVIECEQLSVDAPWVLLKSTFAFCSEWPYWIFLVFHITLLTLLWSLVAWIPPSTLLYCTRKPVAISFLADVSLNFFGLFSECLHPCCFDCFLVLTLTNETQVSSPVTHMMWLRNSLPSLWYCSKNSKLKPFSTFCVHPWAFLGPILCKTCDSLTYLW